MVSTLVGIKVFATTYVSQFSEMPTYIIGAER